MIQIIVFCLQYYFKGIIKGSRGYTKNTRLRMDQSQSLTPC